MGFRVLLPRDLLSSKCRAKHYQRHLIIHHETATLLRKRQNISGQGDWVTFCLQGQPTCMFTWNKEQAYWTKSPRPRVNYTPPQKVLLTLEHIHTNHFVKIKKGERKGLILKKSVKGKDKSTWILSTHRWHATNYTCTCHQGDRRRELGRPPWLWCKYLYLLPGAHYAHFYAIPKWRKKRWQRSIYVSQHLWVFVLMIMVQTIGTGNGNQVAFGHILILFFFQE